MSIPLALNGYGEDETEVQTPAPPSRPQMKPHTNPLFADDVCPTADLTELSSPTVFVRKRKPSHRRSIRDLRRQSSAAEALAGFDHETQIVGFTKGAFSVIDILRATLAITGKAAVDFSTWTASGVDVTSVLEFVDAGIVTNSRWLVDLTFQRRSPELANRIRTVFGKDAIRVAKNHAKFALIYNDTWQIILQTSMNLNFNPRFENFSIAHDPELFGFYKAILDEVWTRQSREIADARPYDIHKHFDADL